MDIMTKSEINTEIETGQAVIIAIVIVLMPFGWDILAYFTSELLIPNRD